MRVLLFLSLGFLSLPLAAHAADSAPLSRCELHRDGAGYTGGCGKIFDESPVLTLAPEKAIASSPWRLDEKPLSAWSGSLKNPGDPDFPLELEVHAGGHGILRTEFGWYSHWVVVETKDGDIDAFDPDDSDRREEIDSLLQSHLPKSP